MGTSRADVAAMLLPIILPFNLLKGCLNAALTALLYRPVVQGLRHAHLFPESSAAPARKRGKLLVWIGSGVLLLASIVIILFLRGIF